MAEGKEPELHLANTREITFEKILDMFRELTGKEPSPEAIEAIRKDWESDSKPS